MNKETRDLMVEKTHELMTAQSCSAEAKAAAQSWLDALGTTTEDEETQKYLNELQEDIVTIDNLIGFASSKTAIDIFGEKGAKNLAAHAKEIKSAGARYCDCEACSATQAILLKNNILK